MRHVIFVRMSHILRMIAEGEHQQQDFKTRIDDSRKIARTLVAFANADGGRLLIGVKDNGTVSGVRVDEELHMVEAAAEMHCRPSIEFRTQVWKADIRSVLEVVVEPSRQRPHRCEDEEGRWKAYLRLEDENIRVNPVLTRCWDHGFRADRPRLNTTVMWAASSRPGARANCSASGRFTRRCANRPVRPKTCSPCSWAGASWKWCSGTGNFMYGLADEQALENLETKGPPFFDLSVLPPSPKVRRLKPRGVRPVDPRALPPDV